jgi:protein-disulfide isomerase
MKRNLAIVPLALSLLLPACGQDKKKSPDSGITREQGDAILNELRQIRQLLENGAGPASGRALEADGQIRLKIASGSWMGNKDAPLTMVEFTDYQCGFCQRFHLETFPEIRKKYIDTGKLRFASRDLPLEFHSNAFHAAEAARCAGDQGQFWPMRDTLVANANKLGADQIQGYAKALKVNLAAFRSCMETGKYAETIRKDVALAMSLRIDGTPSFVIGKSTPEGVSGTLVVGALPFDAFEEKLGEVAK